jgi:Na+-transporting methylmalonyl-CoA/oxaloacetate decarboxylase gamma subunit
VTLAPMRLARVLLCLVVLAVAMSGCGDVERRQAEQPDAKSGTGSRAASSLGSRADAQALVRRLAANSAFAADAGELASLTELGHTLYVVSGEPQIGESHAGGSPDLPADFAWPMATPANGPRVPMSFVGQVRLDELDPVAWRGPGEGLLSFFYATMIERGGDPDEVARVLHLPADRLARRERPRDDRDPESAHPLHPPEPFPAQRWRPYVFASIPSPGASALKPLGMDFEGPRADDAEASDQLLELDDELVAAQAVPASTAPIVADDLPNLGGASLGGWPSIDQVDPIANASYAASDTAPEDWTLLLEVSASVHEVTAAFVIRKADLARGDFSRIYVESY